MLLTIWLWCRACWIIQNAFLNDPKCQKQGFMDLQLVDWLDIAYYAKTNCFLTFGNTSRSQRIIQKYQKSIFEWSKGPKMRFSGFRIDGSTWHCIWWWNYMFSTIWQHHQVMKDHSITIKNIFGWSKEPINRILAISSSLLHLIDLILHTLIFLNDLLKFVKSLVIVLHLMRRLKDWSWACPYRTLQFSTSVEVRPVVVGW